MTPPLPRTLACQSSKSIPPMESRPNLRLSDHLCLSEPGRPTAWRPAAAATETPPQQKAKKMVATGTRKTKVLISCSTFGGREGTEEFPKVAAAPRSGQLGYNFWELNYQDNSASDVLLRLTFLVSPRRSLKVNPFAPLLDTQSLSPSPIFGLCLPSRSYFSTDKNSSMQKMET